MIPGFNPFLWGLWRGRSYRWHGPEIWWQSSRKDNWQKRRKEFWLWQSILSSESDICSLLHFGYFSSEKNKLSSVISKHFWIFSLEFFSGIVQEWSQGRDVNDNLFFLGITTVYPSLIPKKLSNTKFMLNSDILSLAKMRRWPFFLTYLVTGSPRNDWQSNSIPPLPWKASSLYYHAYMLAIRRCLLSVVQLYLWLPSMNRNLQRLVNVLLTDTVFDYIQVWCTISDCI